MLLVKYKEFFMLILGAELLSCLRNRAVFTFLRVRQHETHLGRMEERQLC